MKPNTSITSVANNRSELIRSLAPAKGTPVLSVVVPVYKNKNSLEELCTRVGQASLECFADYELILVNDACPEGSWSEIEKLCSGDRRIKGINLSRNFGQHYAITAGLARSKGDWVVVMDGDLQDRPEEIPRLYAKAQEGFDSVFAQRSERQDSYFKKLQSRVFHRIFGWLAGTPSDPSIGNFGIYRKEVIQAILSMGDIVRFFPAMSQWVGFRKVTLLVKHEARAEGRSSYSYGKLIGMAAASIISFSNKPLRFFVWFGFSMTVLAFIVSTSYFVLAIVGYFGVMGFASIVLSVWFLSGVIIMEAGVIGLYLEKTFNQVKNRPTYIVAKSIN